MAIYDYNSYLRELRNLYDRHGSNISDITLLKFISDEGLDKRFQISLFDVKKDYMSIKQSAQNEEMYNVRTNKTPISTTVSSSPKKTEKKESNTYVPKCPTCGSPDIEKISMGKKAVGGVLFGLLSSDVRKTMHCKNCGYKW